MVKVLYITSIINGPYEVSSSHTFLCEARKQRRHEAGQQLGVAAQPCTNVNQLQGGITLWVPMKTRSGGIFCPMRYRRSQKKMVQNFSIKYI